MYAYDSHHLSFTTSFTYDSNHLFADLFLRNCYVNWERLINFSAYDVKKIFFSQKFLLFRYCMCQRSVFSRMNFDAIFIACLHTWSHETIDMKNLLWLWWNKSVKVTVLYLKSEAGYKEYWLISASPFSYGTCFS